MKQQKRKSRFDALTDAQKEAVYQRCEKVHAEDGIQLNEKDRRLHRKAGLSVGRPRIGQGAKRINVSVERVLLKTADAVAKKRGMTRARLIGESLRAYLKGAA